MEILYTKEAETDYLDASLITVMQVRPGDNTGFPRLRCMVTQPCLATIFVAPALAGRHRRASFRRSYVRPFVRPSVHPSTFNMGIL